MAQPEVLPVEKYKDDFMKIAIYSRKSKFTGKGDSIENQIQLCKEYISAHFEADSEDALIYEDEGFSGGTTDRPQYQQLLHDAAGKKFDLLLCYRLDRISRNIGDFAALIDRLQNYGIGFVSIREQFDTTTPMGRAMMYIASVFAQLERETIAERIRDNMLQLAKTGRWLGGITPTGFVSKEIVTTDDEGKQRKAYRLQMVRSEITTVKLIFDKFLELRSLTKLETYFMQHDIKSKNGKYYSRFALRSILCNPVYATADRAIYDHLVTNGCDIYASQEDFDGEHGIMAYNKTLQKKHTSNKIRDISEWILAVGKHKGVISSNQWIETQTLLMQNKSKSFRKVKNSESLLSGVLRCSTCGSFMRPRTAGRVNSNGEQTFYYMCELKEKSHKQLCSMKNANGNELDNLVIDEIKKLSGSASGLGKKISADMGGLNETQNAITSEIDTISMAIKANSAAITNLVDNVSQSQDTAASKYLIDKINTLDAQNSKFKSRLLQLQESAQNNRFDRDSIGTIDNLVTTFASTIDTLDVTDKRNLLRGIVDRITWDGKDALINLYSKEKKFPQCEYSK
jgi:site-specific DNA recombinase